MKATKSAIRDRLREIRDSYEVGQEITSEHFDFVVGVLAFHPGSDEWEDPETITSVTVDWTKVEVVPGVFRSPNKGFHLHYSSGNEWPFSWEKCLKAMSKEDVAEFTSKW